MEETRINLAIVIPAYEPDEKLIGLINDLNNELNDFTIVVVNDGSIKEESKKIFDEVKDMKNCHLISYDKNMGKGYALKEAFKYIKSLEQKYIIVTADSDGQHHPKDIKKVYDFYLKNQGMLVLGSRKFEGDVPKKSKFGNNVSRALTRIVFSERIYDTQTGLRAFSSDLIDFMLSIKGERYEYEINMISETIRAAIPIREVAIKTIYINENKGTHFRPVKDFLRITSCQIKYLMPILLCLIVNSIAFALLRFFFYKYLGIDGVYLVFVTLVSGFFTVLTGLIVDGLGICFGNRYILKRKDLLANYIIRFLIIVVMDIIFVELFARVFNFEQAYIPLAKILSDLCLAIITVTLNVVFCHKSKLYEGEE